VVVDWLKNFFGVAPQPTQDKATQDKSIEQLRREVDILKSDYERRQASAMRVKGE
jgi:hypothetical protein